MQQNIDVNEPLFEIRGVSTLDCAIAALLVRAAPNHSWCCRKCHSGDLFSAPHKPDGGHNGVSASDRESAMGMRDSWNAAGDSIVHVATVFLQTSLLPMGCVAFVAISLFF